MLVVIEFVLFITSVRSNEWMTVEWVYDWGGVVSCIYVE